MPKKKKKTTQLLLIKLKKFFSQEPFIFKKKKQKIETAKAFRERREKARAKKSPYCFPVPEFSSPTRALILEALEELGRKAVKKPGMFLDAVLRRLWENYAPSTAQTILSNTHFIWELLTGKKMTCRHSEATLKAATRKSVGTPRKKAEVWTLEKAKEEEAKAPKETRMLFRMALALGARSGDLEEGVHVSADRDGWRVGLPFQKTRGTTGRTVARVPRSWCRKVGVWEHIRDMQPGQQLASPQAVVKLQRHLAGRLNTFRRTTISLRLQEGHPADEIREATLHKNNATLFSYVGMPAVGGGKRSGKSQKQ